MPFTGKGSGGYHQQRGTSCIGETNGSRFDGQSKTAKIQDGDPLVERKKPSVHLDEHSAFSLTSFLGCGVYIFFSGAGAGAGAAGAGAAGAGAAGAFSGAGAAGAAAGAGFFSSAFCWQPTNENVKTNTRQRTSADTFFTNPTSFQI
jgi:hypothetical protein